MIITYYFENDNGRVDEYDYEIDKNEAIDYILRTHTSNEILTDYIDEFYDKETKQDIEDWKNEFNFDLTYEGIDRMTEEEKQKTVTEILRFSTFDLIDDSDIYYDELEDYFRQDAFDSYRDGV